MEENISRLFVYGSLRSSFHHAAYNYISSHFTLLAMAKVKGKLFHTGEYPAAVPTFDDSFVIGELYELNKNSEFEWAFDQLDDYEGLHPAEGEDQLYKRELTDVYFNGQLLQSWIYWHNGNANSETLIPTGDVFDYITLNSNLK